MKFKCLVLDHDDTVVQSMKTLSYPFYCYMLQILRPGQSIPLREYILGCHELGFVGLCRDRFGFTAEELAWEHEQWMAYILEHAPDAVAGMDRIIHRQKEENGIVCVVSHSSQANISRDYALHFGLQPDGIYGMDLPPDRRKPASWPLEDIQRRFGLRPEDILVVDDMKLACQMASPLGIAVAYAGWADMGVEEISREMQDLCRWSFSTPERLYQFLFEEI